MQISLVALQSLITFYIMQIPRNLRTEENCNTFLLSPFEKIAGKDVNF